MLPALALVAMAMSAETQETRMVGGKMFRITEHPYCVTIQTPRTMCTGSIISQFFVLTAGHCVQMQIPPHDHVVRAGTRGPWRPTMQIVRGVLLVVNGGFRKSSEAPGFQCNVGLIKVKPGFKFNEFVGKVSIGLEYNHAREDCWMVGSGVNERGRAGILHKLQVWGVRKGKCLGQCCQMEADGNPDRTANGGDSGGPLICGGFLVGVLSSFRNFIQRFETVGDHEDFIARHVKHPSFYNMNEKSPEDSVIQIPDVEGSVEQQNATVEVDRM